jgi:hypothetical protein
MRHLKARAAHLLRTEGVRGLLAGAWRRLRGMRRALVTVERYIIFTFEDRCEGASLTPSGYVRPEVMVLESVEDMRRLASRGFE